MIKSKRSILNSIFAFLLVGVNGILSLVVTRLILVHYGSDFNGLNSAATQMVNMLLVIEGGFTTAINVALFKPMADEDLNAINGIVSAAKKTFRKIGCIYLLAGAACALIYSFVVNSGIEQNKVFLIMFMAILPSGFNLYYATKFRILIQAEQKEYIISIAGLLSISLSYVVNMFTITHDASILTVRFVMMLGSFAQCFIIAAYAKKHYKNIDFSVKPDYSLVKGTRDVMIQKLTFVIYNTIPILFISVYNVGGTKLASVYAVYNSIFALVKSFLYSIVDGPKLSFGQLIADSDHEHVYKKFLEYELIILICLSFLLQTSMALIMPFVKVYTSGVNDINYIDTYIAVMMALITFFEVIHVPSGNIIMMSGNFKTARNIQLTACAVLVVGMVIGIWKFGIYGMLAAILFTAIIQGCMEIIYIHKKYFNRILPFIRQLVTNAAFSLLIIWAEMQFMPQLNSYLKLFVAAVVLLIINVLYSCMFNYLTNMRIFKEIIDTAKRLLRRKTQNEG